MTIFQILVLLMLAYICYRLTVLGSASSLKALATYLIFGLENGLRHEIASAVGTYRPDGDYQLGLHEVLVSALKKVKAMP
ncbi:MAG: hypothetical protein ACRD59_04540 [Candidatus Acidiferrales bacterium]